MSSSRPCKSNMGLVIFSRLLKVSDFKVVAGTGLRMNEGMSERRQHNWSAPQPEGCRVPT